MLLRAAAFDELADDYDASFTDSPVGSVLRSMVWARADQWLGGARRVLELGCGTGEDAVHLALRGAEVVGIDASPAMLRVAQEKSFRRGCEARIRLLCLPVEGLRAALPDTGFDAVFSNFGALNCVKDLPALVRDVGALMQPGARLLWVFLGRHVPWEWSWYLLRAQPRRALRRLPGATSWRGLRVLYPTPAQVTSVLRPLFRIDALRPLGVALPPSYAARWLERRPRALAALTRLEQRAQGSAFLARFADHYIIEATRLPAGGQP
jgi:SAM-dependent methyltransferase